MIWTDICKMAFSFFFIQVIFFYLSLIHNFFLSESGDYWYQLVKLWWIMQLLGCDRKRKKKEEIKLDGDVHRSQEWPFWLPHPWATYNSHPRQTDGLQWIILGPLCTKCAYFRHVGMTSVSWRLQHWGTVHLYVSWSIIGMFIQEILIFRIFRACIMTFLTKNLSTRVQEVDLSLCFSYFTSYQ